MAHMIKAKAFLLLSLAALFAVAAIASAGNTITMFKTGSAPTIWGGAGSGKADASCKGAWRFNSGANETDITSAGTETLVEHGGDDMPTSTDDPFTGDGISRVFTATEADCMGTSGYSGSTDISGTGQSMSFWVRFYFGSDPGAADEIIMAKYNTTGDQRQFRFFYNDGGGMSATISPDGTSTGLGSAEGSTTKASLTGWVDAGFSYNADTDTITIMVNGASDGTGSYSGPINDNCTAPFFIGAQVTVDTAGSGFNGKISEAGIWNRVLTADEWTNLHLHGVVADDEGGDS